MKHITLTIFALFIASSIWAQAKTKEQKQQDTQIEYKKHHLYADAGLSLSQLHPGASATYNYRPLKFLGLGAGAQVHAFFPTLTNSCQYLPAIFGDLRFTIRPLKKNQFFAFLNVGVDFYQHNNYIDQYEDVIYRVTNDNGVYSSIGLGYFRVKNTKRGSGIYFTVKTMSNSYGMEAFNISTKELYATSSSRGTLAVSFGYKF